MFIDKYYSGGSRIWWKEEHNLSSRVWVWEGCGYGRGVPLPWWKENKIKVNDKVNMVYKY